MALIRSSTTSMPSGIEKISVSINIATVTPMPPISCVKTVAKLIKCPIPNMSPPSGRLTDHIFTYLFPELFAYAEAVRDAIISVILRDLCDRAIICQLIKCLLHLITKLSISELESHCVLFC